MASLDSKVKIMTPPQISKKLTFLIVAMVIFAVPLTGAAIDIYVPSLPRISKHFQVTAHLAQLSLTIYLIGYGIFTIVSGALADAIGRRKLITISSFLGAIFSLLAAWSPNIYVLITARFLQGAAISGLGVSARAFFPDIFEGEKLRKMLTVLVIAWAAGPIFAPYIGSHLELWFDWQACFYFLAAYSFLVFLFSFFIPETIRYKHALNISVIKKNYLTIVNSRLFIGWIVMCITFYALLVIFSVIAPFLIEEVMHYSPIQYGRVALALGVAWFSGSFIARLLTRHQTKVVIPKLCIIALLMSMVALIYVINTDLSLLQLIIPALALMVIASTIFSFCYGASLTLFPMIAGSNSAASGTILATSVGTISSLAVVLKTDNDIPLFIAFSVLFAISTLVYFLLVHSMLTVRKK